MKIPTLTGLIDRRILVNYRVDADVLQKLLPHPFRPKLVQGKGIAGICLIRLKNIRPKGLPEIIGLSSENGAHRIAVEWEEDGQLREGVYIPRRDTSCYFNSVVGGRVFPGVHYLADFEVHEQDGNYSVAFTSEDGTRISVKARQTSAWQAGSVFADLDCASCFFQAGSTGYSPDAGGKIYDGMELSTHHWQVSPLEVQEVRSSFFEDRSIFPEGSVTFDNALLMTGLQHEWKSLPDIKQTAVL